MGMLYKRGAVWWIKYYRNGRGLRESSHSTKEGDARRLLKLREGDIEHGLPVDPKLNRIRFEESGGGPEDGVRRERPPFGRRARATDSPAPDAALRRPSPGNDRDDGHQQIHPDAAS